MEADLEHGREATVSRSFASDEESSDALVRKPSMRYRKMNALMLQETEIDGKEWKQGTSTVGPEIEVGESGESSTGSTIPIESPLKASVYYDKVQGSRGNLYPVKGGREIENENTDLLEDKTMAKVLEKKTIITANENQKWPCIEGDWQSNHMALEASTEAYISQSFVTGEDKRELQTEMGTNAFQDYTKKEFISCTSSQNRATATRENKGTITDGGQGAPENAGIQQHQPGNSLSEPVLQNSQNAFVREQDETQPRNHSTRTLEKCISTGNVEEEVVRVLKEQQSHDLLCPVCGSCITKRVILRKRKRTSPVFVDKQHRETKDNALVPASEEDQNDQPETQNEDSEDQNDQPESQNEDSEETETYGCLSCFSLFVRRVTGVQYSLTKGESQSSSKMSQGPRKIVDKEKESIHCLLFLYPGSTKKEPESGPESPQMDIEQKAGVSASKVENGDDLDATITPAGRFSTGPAIHNPIEHAGVVSTASVTIPGIKIVAEAAKDKIPSADRTDVIEEVREMPMADSGAGNRLDHAYGPSKHDVGLDAPSQLNKQHLDQQDVERRKDKFRSVKQLTVKAFNGTQEEIQNELVRHDNLPNSSREDYSAKLDEPNKGSYLCNCIPVSIQSIWSAWPSKETTKDGHLNEPLLHKDRGKESLDQEASIVATESSNHGMLQPDGDCTGSQLSDAHRSEKRLQESGHVESSSTSEEQDRPLLAKNKGEYPVSHSPPISPHPEKTVNTTHMVVSDSSTIIDVQEAAAASGADHVALEPAIVGRAQWDILKSIVYGGLNVSLTSFGVVSSAAGGEAKTLTVIAIGLANMVAGLFMLFNSILDLQDQFTNTIGHNFWFNGSVAVFSYLIFGSLAPITYGFSFQKSDNRNYKFFTTSAVSLVSIILLAFGKARVTTPRRYFRIVSCYVITGFCASIIGYLSGEYIEKLLEKWGFKTDDGNTQKLFYY